MDNLTKQQRSLCMSKIRSVDTQPEKIVREALRQLGRKHRLHDGRLPGRPDVVIPKSKTIIFINGCFWHQHRGCKRQSMPKANIGYWKRKLQRNIEKQKKDIKALKKLGWKASVIWECQTKNKELLIAKLQKILS